MWAVYQEVWRLRKKGAEDEECQREPWGEEDEVEGGEGEDEDVGGEDAKADRHRVDHGQRGPGLAS